MIIQQQQLEFVLVEMLNGLHQQVWIEHLNCMALNKLKNLCNLNLDFQIKIEKNSHKMFAFTFFLFNEMKIF
jgi:hypothetical protein